MLELRGLSKNFGGVQAVDKLTATIDTGEIFGLIGPNGSGKSTTVNLICGVFPASGGAILLNGEDLGAMAPHNRLRAGIARTFQNIRLFGDLTVKHLSNEYCVRIIIIIYNCLFTFLTYRTQS